MKYLISLKVFTTIKLKKDQDKKRSEIFYQLVKLRKQMIRENDGIKGTSQNDVIHDVILATKIQRCSNQFICK